MLKKFFRSKSLFSMPRMDFERFRMKKNVFSIFPLHFDARPIPNPHKSCLEWVKNGPKWAKKDQKNVLWAYLCPEKEVFCISYTLFPLFWVCPLNCKSGCGGAIASHSHCQEHHFSNEQLSRFRAKKDSDSDSNDEKPKFDEFPFK